MSIPRGVRNNNPGNIREPKGDKTVWVGERTTDDDPEFEEFNSPEEGFRAFGKVLRNYQRIYGLNTIRQHITRWAPPNENDTVAYTLYVCTWVGVGADEIIDLTNDDFLVKMLQAMTRMEQGRSPTGEDWWPISVIRAGVKLA